MTSTPTRAMIASSINKRQLSTVDHDENNDCTIPKKRLKATVCKNVNIKPSDYTRSAFKANGCIIEEVQTKANSKFKCPTEEMIRSYKKETLDLVRKQNLEGLKKLQKSGELVNCCNRFGESLLHLACRRGNFEIVQFLVDVAKFDLNIRDDYRRTPLHDAFWTVEPNLEMLDLLLRKVPEHLVLEDARGYTPLDYVRADHQGVWLRFLWERRTLLQPLDCLKATAIAPSAA